MTTNAETYTAEQLIAFEERVKQSFLAGQIRAPVHLSAGNEEQLLEIFKDIRDTDWVFSTWRSHYHALLKGIPEERLYEDIMAGKSMFIHSKEHRFLTSSIVGGILPIALGVALGIKRDNPDISKGFPERVWCFVGDMAASLGIAHEVMAYAHGHGLPLTVVIEDNGLSTDTPTQTVWGEGKPGFNHRRYEYDRGCPHVGSDTWVTFS